MKLCEQGNHLFHITLFLLMGEFQLYLISHVLACKDLHANTNLPNRHFHMNNFQDLNICQFYLPYQSYSYTYLDSTYNHLYKNTNQLIWYTHMNYHHDSIFALNYIHFHPIYVYTHAIHVELKISFHLPLILN